MAKSRHKQTDAFSNSKFGKPPVDLLEFHPGGWKLTELSFTAVSSTWTTLTINCISSIC